jgi:hypothetical protein
VASERKGVAVNLTIEREARDILRALCPSGKSYGLLVSHLLREEERRRLDARQRREALSATAEDVLTAS